VFGLLEPQGIGKILLFLGVILVFTGLIFLFLGKFGLGRLPGDILIKKENLTIYFPITTMILVSVVISLLLYFFRKF